MMRLAQRPGSAEGCGQSPRLDDAQAHSETDQKLEDWLVCHLDDTSGGPASLLESLLANAPVRKRGANGRASAEGSRSSSWSKLSVRKDRNVMVIRFISKRLLREDDLRETADELTAVAAAGYSRIIVNFAGVERLSSQFVGALAAASRRSRASGGELRICGLRPELASLFEITGLIGPIALFPDEAAAHSSPWPISCGPRPLPISILQAIRETGLPKPDLLRDTGRATLGTSPEPSSQAPERMLWLVVETGRHTGKRIPVRSGPFVIGREVDCQLRIRGTTISRRHVLISLQGAWPRLMDLQTTNGTLVNGRLIRGESCPLHSGDRFQVGTVVFRVALGFQTEDDVAEQVVDSWSQEDSEGLSEESTSLEIDTVGSIVVETIQDVVVVHPRLGPLEDDEAISRLRDELNAWVGPNAVEVRLVVDLDQVPSMSSRVLGMLLALALRLERQGGRLRLCRANARVSAMLDAIRMPLLVELLPTLDDAVISAWD